MLAQARTGNGRSAIQSLRILVPGLLRYLGDRGIARACAAGRPPPENATVALLPGPVHRRRSFGQGQVGGQFSSAVPHDPAVLRRVRGQADGVPCDVFVLAATP